MASWCQETEPKVIDDEMLKQSIDNLAGPGEEGRLQREEGIPLKEVLEIRLEFKNILRIDHLWMLTSLKKLSLNNNLIEKMENLDALVNLKELNLSFNKITKIENIESLVNLEILTLFENKISVIENLDFQKNLIILSLGNNLIEDRENVVYLRKFRKLKSVNLAGNPCTKGEVDFRVFVAAFLPQIVYYEYKMFTDEEREEGRKNYLIQLSALEEKEELENIKIAKKEKEIADAEIHSKSFVEYLGGSFLFDSMYEDDPEGTAFLLLGEEITTHYDSFKEQFIEECVILFHFGQEQYHIRQEEIAQYESTVGKAKQEAHENSIAFMEEFLEKKNEIFEKAKKLIENMEKQKITERDYYRQVQELAEVFNDYVHKVWKKLMYYELTIFAQLEDVNELFEISMTELLNTFIETAQGTFTQLRNLQNAYNDKITDILMNYTVSKRQEMEEVPEFPEELEEYLVDKDTLGNAIGASQDIHMQIIDKREDTLIERARKWLQDVVDNMVRNEVKRSRMKVLEINHYLDIQREEFEELLFLPEEA